MRGYFIVYENTANEDFDVKFELHPDLAKNEVPDEQQVLYIEVEKANNVIRSLNNSDYIVKKKYFDKLLSLAQAGLVGETAQPNLALKSLHELKDEVLSVEGQRIKNSHMAKLGQKVCFISFIVILFYLSVGKLFDRNVLRMYCVTLVGAMVGAWVSFGMRKFSISFEQLSVLEEDMMNGYIRLFYVGICSIIFLLFLNSGIINVDIGGISTENIRDNIELQAIVGIICGLVESKLGINIYKKSMQIVGGE